MGERQSLLYRKEGSRSIAGCHFLLQEDVSAYATLRMNAKIWQGRFEPIISMTLKLA